MHPTPSTLAQSKQRKGSNFAIWQPCPRYEAASAVVGNTMFVMGGIGEGSVEFINAARKGAKWQSGPSLPAVTARACAAGVDSDTVIISGGHGNGSAGSVRSAHMLSARDGLIISRAYLV